MRSVVDRTRVSARRLTVLLLVLALISAGLVAGARSAFAAGCTQDTLVPQLRGVTVNQGLGSYANLVRGKNTVVRFFLSLPQCAAGTRDTVSIKSAILNVKSGGQIVHTVSAPLNNLSTPPNVLPFAQAPDPNHTGDPLWIVSGSAFNSLANVATPLSFEATIGYVSTLSASTKTIPFAALGGQTITKNLLPTTNPMRILAIPMGDPSPTAPDQFTAGAKTATESGFATLGRMFPVAHGLGSLGNSGTAGVRYALDENTILDVTDHMSGGKFCGTSTNFDSVKSELAAMLQQYNTGQIVSSGALLSKAADSVMGVVDRSVSAGCAEGMGAVNGKESWVTAHYGASTTPTGAVMGMEKLHNFGGVPCGRPDEAEEGECPVDRDDPFGDFHSQWTAADGSDPNRAYNILAPNYLNGYISDDRTVARFQSSGWTNSNTLLEKLDFELSMCRLGGPQTPDCVGGNDPVAAAAPAEEVTLLTGTTNGTAAGTTVFDSFVWLGAKTREGSGPLRLIQENSAGVTVSEHTVRTVDTHSHHAHDGTSSDGHTLSAFAVAYATHPTAARFKLVNSATGEVLYQRDKFAEGDRPQVTKTELESLEPVDPTPTPSPSVLGGEGDFSDEAREDRITFDSAAAGWNGTEIKGQYESSHGVTFFSDEDVTTPRIVGDCVQDGNPCRFPVGARTHSPRFNLWNQPRTLPVGPVDPVPSSAGVPLTFEFTAAKAPQKVGMYVGNDDAGRTVATLTAYDAAGKVIISTSAAEFGADVETFLGLDAGQNSIHKVTLDYGDAVLGEEIDDLIVERGTIDPAPPPNKWRLKVTGAHRHPGLLKAAFFAKCPSGNLPLKVGVDPDAGSVSGSDDRDATFTYEFDARRLCFNGTGKTILVRLNDGYTTTTFTEVQIEVNPSPNGPTPVITTPEADALAGDILSHEAITLNGHAWDIEDGVLDGSNLEWFLSGPGISNPTQVQGTGQTVVLPAPNTACGWTEGEYTATLKATDSDGNSTPRSVTFEVRKDCDNDGVSVQPCPAENDADQSDAINDFDKDGIPNHADGDPCTAASSYNASADFEPNTLNVPSTGGNNSVTMLIRLPERDLTLVNGSSVAITGIGGRNVEGQARFKSMAWSVKNGVATAKFDRQALIDFIYWENGVYNAEVGITVGGTAPKSGKNPSAWNFSALDTTFVQLTQ